MAGSGEGDGHKLATHLRVDPAKWKLDYTTGPWESPKSRDLEKRDAFGHFVTIWQKNKDNVWKVALDVGLDHPQPQGVETEISTYIPNAAIPHSESISADLEKAQRSFAESLEKDEGHAIIDNASDNIRVCRSGKLPAVGKNAAGKMLGEEDAKMTRAPSGTGITSPVDLAYKYGEYTRNRDKARERGIYFCIWRLESDGTWKIALDLQKSAPTEKP